MLPENQSIQNLLEYQRQGFIASSYIDYRVGIQALRVISRAQVSKLLHWYIVTMDDHCRSIPPVTPSAKGTAHSLSTLPKNLISIQIRRNQVQHAALNTVGRRYRLRSLFAEPLTSIMRVIAAFPHYQYKKLPELPWLNGS